MIFQNKQDKITTNGRTKQTKIDIIQETNSSNWISVVFIK